MTIEASRQPGSDAARRSRPAWLAFGGMLAAVGASSCCVLPFALFVFGVSGAWVGSLTALAPYQPIFLVFGLLCVGAGLLTVYRRPRSCGPDDVCATPPSQGLTKAALWAAAALIVSVLLFPVFAPLFIQA
ncbi:MAG: mercury transporter MerT [Proteobacteria bacterium]|nr:mercury transporter MerT [Pseudomonadota bacterium]